MFWCHHKQTVFIQSPEVHLGFCQDLEKFEHWCWWTSGLDQLKATVLVSMVMEKKFSRRVLPPE